MKVAFKSEHPKVTLFRNFLSDAECQALIDASEPRMAPSYVMNSNGVGQVRDSVRSSYGASMSPGEFQVVTNRAAEATGSNPAHFETMQMLRYRNEDGIQQEYKPHFDFFFPQHPSSVEALNRGGQRNGTLIIYLETPDEGGETTMPDAGLSFSALRGDALWFEYDTPSEDTKTRHAGAPVIKGTKRIATLWRRVNEFDSKWPDLRVVDNVLTVLETQQLKNYYESRANEGEGGTDNVIRFQTLEQDAFIQPYVEKLKNQMLLQFGQLGIVETVVLACMPADMEMNNHADNVKWDGTQHIPNHTPDRIYTAVVFLDDGPGGAVVYGQNEGYSQYQKIVEQKAGRLHAHRCGPNYYHQVQRTQAPRHTFIVWFKG